jgi:hypothetical protein
MRPNPSPKRYAGGVRSAQTLGLRVNQPLNATFDKTKTLAIGAFLTASFAWLGWIVIESVVSAQPLTHVVWLNSLLLLLGAVTAVCMPVVVAWHLFRAWRTELSESGIFQPQLRGSVQVRWNEFTSAKVSAQFRVDLRYPGGKVIVAAGLYTEPESVSTLVLSKLTKLGHARTEA